VIRHVVPDGVVAVEGTEEDSGRAGGGRTASTLPDHRRREFAHGRACAAEALAALGCPDVEVPVGSEGEPIWPPGVVGSLAHRRGYAAAAVAPRSRLRGLGIDVEIDAALSPGAARRVCAPAELAAAEATGLAAASTVVFSAKESVYKAVYPLTRRRLTYGDVTVRLDPDVAAFEVDGALRASGCFAIIGGRIFTAVPIGP